MARRIVSIQFSHETNTFSSTPTDMAAFRRRIFVEGEEVARRFRGTRTELGAHLEAAANYGWELIQPFAAHGTPSGLVSREMLDYCVNRLIEAARDADGAILALHGSMVAQEVDDAEGYLLEKLRTAMGPKAPIVITLDTHANVTAKMAQYVNGLYAYRTYPHVDQHELATEACALMNELLETQNRPQVHVFRLPIIDGCDHGRTHGQGVMRRLLDCAAAIRASEPGFIAVEVTAGFPWSDIEEVGPAVTVTSHLERAAVLERIQPLLSAMWETRAERSVELLDLHTLVAEIRATPEGEGPIVIADFSDNPGHGAPGDGIGLVRALHDAGIQNVAVACICDPEAVQACFAAGQGAQLELKFGNKAMPELYGPHLHTTCEVVQLGDGNLVYEGPMRKGTRLTLGPTATVRYGSVKVVLATNNIQVQDFSFFRANGIEPLDANVLVVKSQQHFRAAFAPIARRILLADSGGFVSPDLARLPYRKVRRPVWPLDDLDTAMPAVQ
ncbi:MAG TPA: M81 family metallopeptidase [Burkholderiaceae bacterium]|nr:M81 family metallopeptidase [Burkholderiaceae bacterium]